MEVKYSGPFFERGLEEGILKASNGERLQFGRPATTALGANSMAEKISRAASETPRHG
jgi:hypothetical protein